MPTRQHRKPLRAIRRTLIASLVAACLGNAQAAEPVNIDIAAQPLAAAVAKFAEQSGIKLLYAADLLAGKNAPRLEGKLTPQQALEKLLAGNGLRFQFIAADAVKIEAMPAEAKAALPTITITDQAESTYKPAVATIAGKVPLAPKEIPQSVSVITRAQIDDQGLVTVEDALRQVSGMTIVSNDTLNSQYWSRGYWIGMLHDGVSTYNRSSQYHQFDLALYDRVEVLRGPTGLLRGAGEPGGAVNLVRKTPQKETAFSWAATLGSWNTRKLEGDVTGSLNADGSLRGRVVLAQEDRGYFSDHTHTDKWVGMAAFEYDLGPQTTLSAAFMGQDAEAKASYYGLPTSSVAGADGHFPLLNVPRDTYPVPDWNRSSYHTEQFTGGLSHRFDNEWQAKLIYNHRTQNQYYKYAYTYSGVSPTAGTLSYRSSRGETDTINESLDIFASGPFMLLGRKHHLTLGYNVDTYNYQSRSGSGATINNIAFGDISTLTEPTIAYTSGSEQEYTQSGLYSQLRLSLADPLTAVLGGRSSTVRAKSRNIAPSTSALAWVDGAKANHEFTPYGGLIYDLTRQVSLYASYTDIFVPQTQKKLDGAVLDPRVGRQYETGAKGEFFEGKLGASLALFNIRDKNRAFADPADPLGNAYLNAGEIESKGWEMELTGQLIRGLEISGGYTNLTTRYLKDKANEGKVYSIFTPRHQLRLWGNYRFAPDTALAGWNAGLGAHYNSKAQSTRGWRDEIVNDSYAVMSAQVGYQVDKTYSLSLQINNLLDKKYYASVGTKNTYNFYGEPRNAMLTLRARY